MVLDRLFQGRKGSKTIKESTAQNSATKLNLLNKIQHLCTMGVTVLSEAAL